jgi:hypothetical protein
VAWDRLLNINIHCNATHILVQLPAKFLYWFLLILQKLPNSTYSEIRNKLSRSIYKRLNVLHSSTLLSLSKYRAVKLRRWWLSCILELLLLVF